MKNIYRCTCQSVPVAESERTEEEGCERKRSKRGKQYNLFNFMKSIQNNLFGFDKNRNNYYSYTNKGKVVYLSLSPIYYWFLNELVPLSNIAGHNSKIAILI